MGEENIFRMCADFYALIEQSPIRPMFSDDLPQASKNLAAFFVGLCGGPPLFRQRRGEPMMRARHLAFAIDEKARRIWLDCFFPHPGRRGTKIQLPRRTPARLQAFPGRLLGLDGESALKKWSIRKSLPGLRKVRDLVGIYQRWVIAAPAGAIHEDYRMCDDVDSGLCIHLPGGGGR
jgi:hypothetical protein